WTRITADVFGRTIEVATFAGLAKPAATGYVNGTGKVTTDYGTSTSNILGPTVTVTDQAGKPRRSLTDALGRLVRVDEPDASNSLGTTASPAQATSYDYDVFGNLRHVYQGSQTRTFTYDSLSRLRAAANPESGTITYTYDDNGNLLTKTDARPVTSTYVYDALNRNTTVTYTNDPANTPTVKRYYDGWRDGVFTNIPNVKGRLWQTETVGANGSRTTINSFDALGRPLSESQQFYASGAFGQAYTTQRGYNLAGGVTSQTYPSGHTVTYNYDQAGRLGDKDTQNLAFTGNLGDGVTRTYSSGIIYLAGRAMTKEKFGTDTAIYNKLFYNSRGQLAEIRESTSYTGPTDTTWNRGAIINHYSNQAGCWGASCNATDNNGNLKKQEVYIPNNDQVTSYTTWWQRYDYDNLNRLQRVSEVNGSQTVWQQEYVYDRYGNRTMHQTNTWGGGINKKDFSVSTTNNRLSVPNGQTGVMSYDAAGNLTNDTYTGAGSRVYDAENRMTSAGSAGILPASYTYNADGQRVRRKVNGVETWQVYGMDGELVAEYAASAAATVPQKEYGYRNGQLLITAEAPAASLTNVALAANGAVASASSIYNSSYPANATNNGDRKGLNWGNGGGWNDAEPNYSFPDWVQVDFNGSKSISEIDVFTIQDNYPSPAEPTETMTFSTYGLTGYDVQYWNGSAWVTVPGGSITGNNKVWRKFSFSPIATTKIRVLTNASVDGYSRLVELEAWSTGATSQNVSWTNVSSTIQVTGNSVQKTSGTNAWDAGAVSTQTFASGDGYVEFTPGETQTWRMCGLGNGDTTTYYTDIEYAIFIDGGAGLSIYESGNYRGSFGTYAAGDRLKVAVESGVVKYYRNSTLIYTSTVAPQYPLLVDTSLNTVNAGVYNVVITSSTASASGNINWLVADQLGTPRMIFDKTGSLAATKRHDYLPFGEELFAGQGGRTTAQGYSASDNVRQKFTQKERDNETGLDYFLARYYSSNQGRFTSPDEFTGGPDELY
ncbi:MAG: RHS repeat-associated core domain-containing protein, partial [Pyrinomonadaceae bacterium]